MPRLFDTYIMVDWSAASSPKTGKDSVWIAERNASSARTRFHNPPTRTEAFTILCERLSHTQTQEERVLLGFDFSLGYPAGTANALGFPGTPWRAMFEYLTEKIEDAPDNSNNRFVVAAEMNRQISGQPNPFWGVTSKRHITDTLAATKPELTSNTLSELRIVERYLRQQKAGTPKSVWQLAYIGSVGSQSLMGIPYVEKLRHSFPQAKVWPFETGLKTLTADNLKHTNIVIAEIYPSLVNTQPNAGEPLDKAQVRAIARHYWEMDKSGDLGAAFAPPSGLNAANLLNINKEEGWILGITPINIGNLAS